MKEKDARLRRREKIWQVMRGLNAFSVPDIMEITGLTERVVYRYMSNLLKGGYLRVSGGKKSFPGAGKSQKLYRLVKNPGPKAPRLVQSLYDPNTGEYKGVKDVD